MIGSALEALREVPGCITQTTITSPPYFQQRDFQAAGQIGWETSSAEYVAALASVLAELWRVTAPIGSCFIVIGDTYIDKALQLVPHRLALAACEQGWVLRNDLIWAKADAAPDGAADRWRISHEHVLFLTKSRRGYRFHADAIRVPHSSVTRRRWGNGQQYGGRKAKEAAGPSGQRFKRGKTFRLNEKGALPRDVLEFPTARSPLDHFATFPPALVEKLLLATTDPGDLVLDPFAGTATTGVVAITHGRRFLGIELNPNYAKLGRQPLRAALAAYDRHVAVRFPETRDR